MGKEIKKSTIVVTFSLFVLFLIVLVVVYIFSITEIQERYSDLRVSEVIDGDTFKIQGFDKSIRLLCVDAPEEGDTGFEDSKNYLDNLLIGEPRLEYSNFDREDKYGRVLAFVYIEDIQGNEVFVNKKLVEEGYAKILELNEGECDLLRN